MPKVAIIGAGPIGCYLGQLLKKQGFKPLLIEEHKELGRPVHCTGLVGKKVFTASKVNIPAFCILNRIDGAVVHLGKEAITIKRDKVAYVIERERFDKFLGRGLNIRFETRFLGLEKKNGKYIIETDKGDITADIVAGADGARSMVREYVYPGSVKYLKGVQFRMKAPLRYKNMVEVYIKKPYFYWIVPESNDTARVGVISRSPYSDILNFIKKEAIKGKIIEKFAGIVPLTYFRDIVYDNICLLGDSACQVKPLTYGGIYMGMRAAEILADCIKKGELTFYSDLWFKKFGKEISMGLKARQIYNQLNSSDVKRIFSFVKNNYRLIEKKADFEKHSLLVWEFLKHPFLSKDLAGILFSIIKANFSSPIDMQS